VDGHSGLLVEEDLIVPLGTSSCVTEVFGQALSVCTDGADHSELELLGQTFNLVNVTVPSVLGPISALHLVALRHILPQDLDSSHCCTLDIILRWLSDRLSRKNVHSVCIRDLRIVEGAIENPEFPGFPYKCYLFIIIKA
jgi:hypothetical protein